VSGLLSSFDLTWNLTRIREDIWKFLENGLYSSEGSWLPRCLALLVEGGHENGAGGREEKTTFLEGCKELVPILRERDEQDKRSGIIL
jgi:hypothetical protein